MSATGKTAREGRIGQRFAAIKAEGHGGKDVFAVARILGIEVTE